MTRAERIERYEQKLNRAGEAARRLEDALDAFDGVQGDLKALERYYTSAQWKADFDADSKGRLPAELKRGVLSEDGIDHLLERCRELRERCGELANQTKT